MGLSGGSAVARSDSRLTASQESELAENGFLVLPDLLTQSDQLGLRAELDRLTRSEGLAVGATFPTALPARTGQPKRPYSQATLEVIARLSASWAPIRRRIAARRRTDTFFLNPSDFRRRERKPRKVDRKSLIGACLEILEATGIDSEAGVIRVANLVNKGQHFERCFDDPAVLSAVSSVIGEELKLSSLNGRTPQPGYGGQFIHADWNTPPVHQEYQSVNVIWLLDDFTLENGATRVIPGSHKRSDGIRQAVDEPFEPQPGEVLVTASAGSAIIMNGHLWHSGTTNNSSKPRAAIQAYFVRRCHEQQLDQSKWLTPDTAERLNPRQRWILG